MATKIRNRDASIAASTLAEAKKKVEKLKSLGYGNPRISKIDKRSLTYRTGYRYWISYDLPKKG